MFASALAEIIKQGFERPAHSCEGDRHRDVLAISRKEDYILLCVDVCHGNCGGEGKRVREDWGMTII